MSVSCSEQLSSRFTLIAMLTLRSNLFNFNESFMADLLSLHKECGYETYYDKYLTFPPSGQQPTTFFNYTTGSANLTHANPALTCDIFDLANKVELGINPCFDIYEIVGVYLSG